ncbi:MAG: trigger factor [Clostridiales bacterium]|nr:trigger factor [Clostridiales bacterium]
MVLERNEKTAENTVELEILVDREEFDKAIETAYRKNVGKITVPGFRRGKAPRKTIERLYGASVFYEDAVNESYQKAYEDAVKESEIKPIDHPKLEIFSISEEGYKFKAVVTVEPIATLGDYKAIRVEKQAVEVTEEDVESEVKRRAEQNARIATAERAAATGDIAVIDYSGFLGEEQFEGGTAENHELKLGSGQFIPGFEDQIVGHSAGEEFDVNVTFPEQYHSEDLAGKEVVFKVKLHEVKESIVPEIDDEFAKDVSEFETLEEYKNDLKANLLKNRQAIADQDFENSVLEKLIETMTVEIPDVMIERAIDNIVEDFSYRMQMQGISMEQYIQMTGSSQEAFRANFRDRAEHQVKVSLALSALVEAESVEVTDEDVEAGYAKLANEQFPVEKVKEYLPEEKMRADCRTEKAVNIIKEIAAQSE